MSGYAFHPDAFADLDEIWEYIAQDNVDAADRVLADIHSTRTTLAGSPQIGHRRPDLTTRPYDSTSRATSTVSATHLMRSRFGLSRFSTGAEIRG
jgi:plasmid stabilization system protein ParE